MHLSRPTLFLTLAVVAAHALVLLGVSKRDASPARAVASQVFMTRTVKPPPTPEAHRANDSQQRSVVTPRQPQKPPRAPAKPRQLSNKPKAEPKALQPAVVPLPYKPPAPVQQIPDPAELLALGFDVPAPLNPAPPQADTDVAELAKMDNTRNNAGGSAAGPGEKAPNETRPLETSAQERALAQPGELAEVAQKPIAAPAKASAAPVPILLPAPRRLGFNVTGKAKGFGYSARAELLWEHDATGYRAHQEVKVMFLGARSQTSVGSITEWGLEPRRFDDRARSERTANFDFAAGQATFSANTPSAAIAPGAQDRLSVFLQLASMLGAEPARYPAGTEITMNTVSARSADVWTFTVVGDETLDLPVGQLAAVQLQRLPRQKDDQKAQVWLAPSLGYLPVRIRLTEANGDYAELNLRSEEAP